MLKIESLSLERGGRVLFEDFNLVIEPGEKVLLKGPSGKGKTTLLKTVLGFAAPVSGRIVVAGTDLTATTAQACRRSVAYLPQDVDLPGTVVSDALDRVFHYNANHVPTRDRILAAFAHLGLDSEHLDKGVVELSGGERRRVGLALCALLDRSLWILDEPSTGLDPERVASVGDFILGQEAAILAVSHEPTWDGAFRGVEL